MGTPIRHLVCKALSPNKLSPNTLNTSTFLNNFSPCVKQNSSSSTKFVKSLNYPNSPNKINFQVADPSTCQSDSSLLDIQISDFKIVISNAECSTNENSDINYIKPENCNGNHEVVLPFINTPNRREILKNGLCAKPNWNVLGKGSYGTVIQAIYKGEKVAAKIVPNNNNKNSLDRERNSLKLKHENIVKTMKVACEPMDNYGVVLMEDCSEYDNMQNILEDSSFDLSLNVIIEWLLHVCEALIYCHENGVIHLDVKPKNILVHKHTKCKICDFGNSLDIFSQSQKDYIHQGTVVYTAPEIFQAKMAAFSADVYSLGITMWQMYSRVMPYHDIDNKEALIYFVVKHNLRPVSPEHVVPWYNDLYTQCWETEASLRPRLQTIKDMLKKNKVL